MPYKPTGQPQGRPKTNWYETLSARVPQELADQVRKYAARHRQTLSDVLRDGFTMLLQDDRYAPMVSDRNDVSVEKYIVSYMNKELEIKSDTNGAVLAPEMVSDMNSVEEITSDINSVEKRVSDMHGEQEIVSDINTTPAYDTKKFSLGKLCPQGHDYQGTGKTLLRLPKYVCPQCDAARARERRQAQRQAAG